MPTHHPIGSCCSRPRFNVVGGLDAHGWPHFRWTRRQMRVRRTCEAAVGALVGRAHKIGCAKVWLAALLKNRGSL